MNNSIQAKNGFKTFMLTLVVSLFVFSIVYYIASDTSSKKVDIEENNVTGSVSKPATVAANTSGSAFEDLSKQKMNVPQRAVLAGSTVETTQSTIPVTGSTEITYAFLISMIAIFAGAYYLVFYPRKRALAEFEDRVTRDLDNSF
jgi:hypothetical protein